MIDLPYREQTVDSRNPLKRFSHRNRFGQALDIIDTLNPKTILDYGSADGFLYLFGEDMMQDRALTLFEPVSYEDTLANFPPEKARVITKFADLDALDEQFDLITRHFEPPTEEEGFRIVRYSIDGELPRP